jgi:hypothetical protein
VGPFFIGAAGPMIHRLSTWMLLILAHEAVQGQFLVLVLAGMAVGGAADPLGAAGPSLSREMNRLRLVTLRIALE